MTDHRNAFDQRHKLVYGQTEGVEQRQTGHQHILFLGVHHIRNLFQVGHNVLMAEHDTFRRPFATTGEQDGGGLLAVMRVIAEMFQNAGGQHPDGQPAPEGFIEMDLAAQVLEINDVTAFQYRDGIRIAFDQSFDKPA